MTAESEAAIDDGGYAEDWYGRAADYYAAQQADVDRVARLDAEAVAEHDALRMDEQHTEALAENEARQAEPEAGS